MPDAVGTEHTSVGCANVTPVTWAPDASARRERTRAGTRTCAERRKASLCAADAGSAAATSAPASRVSSGGSTGPSASVTAFPVPETRASYAQVGLCPLTFVLSQTQPCPFKDGGRNGHASGWPGRRPGISPACHWRMVDAHMWNITSSLRGSAVGPFWQGSPA